MFDSVAKQWVTSPTGNLADGYMNKNANGWQQLSPTISTTGDGDPNQLDLGGIGFSPEFLQQIGYTGADPLSYRQGENLGVDPAFVQYLQNQGLTLGRNTRPGDNGGIGKIQLGAFDGTGNQKALSEWDDDPDNQFGAGILGAATFGIGSVLGAGGAAAGSAGAGGGGGGLSAEQLAYGALENGAAYGGGAGDTLLASAGSGLPEGALGAGEAAGYGGGAAADAAGMGLAEGAYPAGLGYGGTAAGGGGFLSSLGSAASDASTWMGNNKLLTSVGGGLLNTAIGAYSANNALNAQKDATNQANALWAPYRDLGNTAVGGYSNLLKNPNSVLSDPGVAFQQQQGQQALDRRATAGGGMYSGAQMKAASRYNQDYASTALDKALARYGNAAQLGATGTNATANNVTNLGNAAGSASLYTGNVAQQGVNNALASLNQSSYGAGSYQDYLKKMYGG